MKFMVMHKHSKNTEAGIKPPQSLITAMGKLIGGMAQTGRLIDGAGLGASATRSRVTLKNGERTVRHGPYGGGANELPAGYALVSVKDRDAAIDWAARIGQAISGDVELEVGKVTEPWDLGVAPKPENPPYRALIIHKATPDSEAGKARGLSGIKQEMKDAGVLVTSAEVAPSSKAKRLTFKNGERKVVDGPFAESKELIGGFAVLEMPSMDEVVAFSTEYAQILLTAQDELEIDIRPV